MSLDGQMEGLSLSAKCHGKPHLSFKENSDPRVENRLKQWILLKEQRKIELKC